ncbi:MAG: triple tyrosine motif-containing protein, partial [Rhodothermales bacterium]
KGLPFITNYGPKDYGGDGQNWAVTQDHRGVMYFGNGNGVYEYDGISWRNIPLSNSATVRSLGVAADGTVYVGGVRDLGYLTADDHGRTKFVSILPDIPEDERDFSDVWHTFPKDDGVYFFTDDRMIVWNQGAVKITKAKTNLHVAFDLGDAIYLREWERGLERLEGDQFVLVPGGEQFADERVYNMLPFGDGRILVTTRTKGQLVYDGKSFKPWKSDVDAYLKENLVYLGGSVLPDGDFALPTIAGGLVILGHDGRNSEIIDRSKGILDNSVLFTHVDMSGDLWLGLNAGLARIEISSPFTVFDDRSGITSTIGQIARYEGDLYAASQVGVYKYDPRQRYWTTVPGLLNQTFSLGIFKDRLLVAAGNDGVFQLSNGRMVLVKGTIDNTYAAGSIEPSRFDSNRVYIGLLDGLSALRLDQRGAWVDEGTVPGLDNIAFGILETSPTTFWAGSFVGGLARVTLPDDGLPRPLDRATFVRFGADKGISDRGASVFQIGGTIYAASRNGYARLTDAGTFVPDSTFSSINWVSSGLVEHDDKGRAWMTFGREVALVTPQADGSFDIETEPFRRLIDDQSGVAAIDGDVIWFSSLDGIVRYDESMDSKLAAPQETLIREVTVGRDSLIYGGLGPSQASNPLTFDHNSVRFEFANLSYQEASQNRYQTFLEGFDSEWSDWSNETKQSFTNLPPGRYTFRVRARDVSGRVGKEATFDFEVLPPWYRTIWAYGFYLLALAGFGIGFDRLMRFRVVKKERERSELLEAQLRAQTAEAQAQTVEAEAKALQVENERQKNIELLSEMGRDITATLSIAGIIDTVYENVNDLMDAAVFTIGIYNKEHNQLDFPATR